MPVFVKKFFGHLRTVSRHRRSVLKMSRKCGILYQGLIHDLSKYSPSEFIPSVEYWTGTRSPLDVQIEHEGYSSAWLHHKGKNKHHFEYWHDPIHLDIPVKMPIKYVAEMFCDNVSASKTYLGNDYKDDSALKYILSRPKTKELMHPETYALFIRLLEMLAKKGEEKTCRYIACLVHRGKY